MPEGFGGVKKQGVSNPPDKPRELENVRLTTGGPITERPGQSKLGNAMASAVVGIFDPTLSGGMGINDPARSFSRLVVIGASSTGVAALWLGSYTPEESSNVLFLAATSMPNAENNVTPLTIFRHDDGHLYAGGQANQVAGKFGFGTSTGDYHLELMRVSPVGPAGLGLAVVARLPGIAVGAGGHMRILPSMCSLMGTLYFTAGTEDPTLRLSTETYSFDGAVATEIDSVTDWAAGDQGLHPIVIPFREQLVVLHYIGAATDKYKIRHRNLAGTWSDGVVAALDAASKGFSAFDAVVYKDRLYVAGYGRHVGDAGVKHAFILVYDGTTWSVARSIADTVSTGAVTSLYVFNGLLYYSYVVTSGAFPPRLGRFDGTTWTDNHFSFPGDATSFKFQGIVDMYEFGRDLFAVKYAPIFGGGPATRLYRSAGAETTSWTAMPGSSGGTVGNGRTPQSRIMSVMP